MSTKDYLKYYWLETDYLEKEVYSAFHENGYLTPEEFFSIIFWKSKRPVKRIREGLSNESVKEITKNIFEAKTKQERLKILLKHKQGFNLAMASAVLTILYPNEFTVYDFRVREMLGYVDISNLSTETKIEKYFQEYIPKVRATDSASSLRNCDRILWAKSWHQDLLKFLSVHKTVVKMSGEDLQQS